MPISVLHTLSALHQCKPYICINIHYQHQHQYWPEQWSWWPPSGWWALVCAAAVSWCRRMAVRSPTTALWKCYRTDDLQDVTEYPCPFHHHPDICDAPDHRQLQTVKTDRDSWVLTLDSVKAPTALLQQQYSHKYYNCIPVSARHGSSVSGWTVYALSLIHIWRCRRRG